MAKKLTAEEIDSIRKARWLARTDLLYLCNHVLGYKDVSKKVHGGLIAKLQSFPKPTREQYGEYDVFNGTRWIYRPILPMQKLPGKRRRLILDSRGHLKTTINCAAHTVQWILNYPEISLQVIQSNLDKAIAVVNEIRDHFRYNPVLRKLFPELCPEKKVEDFGKMGEFETPERKRIFLDRSPELLSELGTISHKEPTVMCGSIDKGSAGLHFDVMKFSDIVDPNNCQGDLLEKVAKSFYMMENLLVSPLYWLDVEGTRYNFGDVYGKIIEEYERQVAAGEEPNYDVYIRACFHRDTGSEEPKYTPAEQMLPFKKDSNGNRIPVWPERFPADLLQNMEKRDPAIFSAQQLNFPIGGVDGRLIFEVDSKKNLPALISKENFVNNVRVSHYEISVDTAETVGARSDYTAMVVCAWSKAGRPFIVDILHGKYLPSEIVDNLFILYKKWSKSNFATVREIKIEETGFVRGLNAAIKQKESKLGIYLPLKFIKRETTLSKQERIIKTLQPWYVSQDLRFLDTVNIEGVKKELIQFPNSPHDDILDALSDLFTEKEYFGRLEARATETQARDIAMDRFLDQLAPWDPDYIDIR